MGPICSFHVRPSIPDRLGALEELAYNLRWSWDHETIALFRRLDRDLWETSGHNPVLMLGSIAQERLQEAAQDDAFLAHLDRWPRSLRDYVARRGNLVPEEVRRRRQRRWSPTSRWSSASPSACPSTRAGSASSPATT